MGYLNVLEVNATIPLNASANNVNSQIRFPPIIDIDGTIYVAYKVDGNNHGHGGICGNTVPPLVDTPVLLQRLAEDAITPVGPPVDIIDCTRDDGPPVEAPALVRGDEGVHFLFFGSGCTRMPSHDLEYATSTKSMAHTSVPPDRY